ncbi:Glycosyltransferase, catalytic subunit of cellulose synthase and poly-beta-1,6-N-acetylglucosamine synthase [Spirosomataceae bacterium TFI 002]|nr:Glycosyltransferase, catalytic subunit of cellulose synthase and poly-beta-1,6-N-acetylglucosamine synthase [Spirosomataceae bacterium TFI 002]
MNWEYVLPIVFFTCLGVQLIYLLGVFPTLNRHVDFEVNATDAKNKPGVSVIVCALNEIDNLKELLPLLENQDYPNFEIIVVDDRSEDGTYDYLLNNEGNFSKVKFVRILNLPEHFTAKKYALTMGIKKSTNNIILLTDADCRPNSNKWISSMETQLTSDRDLVLGFSPYYRFPGYLNAFIRYETFQTALQYFSFAKAGFPFMGVGRNLMYRKDSFWKNNGFASHKALLSGDDDLFVNAIANKKNTEIRIDRDSWMDSEPKQTFDDWITQKKRHLSVGKVYKTKDKVTIGALWLSFIGTWLLVIPTFFTNPSWFQLPDWLIVPDDWLLQYGLTHWTPFNNWMRLVVIVFLAWFFLRWLILHIANKKLGSTIRSSKIPVMDFIYLVYLLTFGIITIFSNPKKIKWR